MWVEKQQMGYHAWVFLPKFRTNTADIYIARMGYHFRRKISGKWAENQRKIGGILPKIAVLSCRGPEAFFLHMWILISPALRSGTLLGLLAPPLSRLSFRRTLWLPCGAGCWGCPAGWELLPHDDWPSVTVTVTVPPWSLTAPPPPAGCQLFKLSHAPFASRGFN